MSSFFYSNFVDVLLIFLIFLLMFWYLLLFVKKFDKDCQELVKKYRKSRKKAKFGSSAYEMSNFTSLLFHRSTLSLVRAHMAEVPGGFPGGFGGVRRGSGDPKNRKKPKKSQKMIKKSIFLTFFLVFGCFWPEPRENMGKMVEKRQKRGQKRQKTPQKQGFSRVSGKTSKRTSAPYGTFWPQKP